MIEKEKKRQRMVNKDWERRQELKKRVINPELSDEERQDAMIQLNKMRRNGSVIRLRNRCKLTGRARGYLRKFQLSRITFREYASHGLIPGVTKASW